MGRPRVSVRDTDSPLTVPVVDTLARITDLVWPGEAPRLDSMRSSRSPMAEAFTLKSTDWGVFGETPVAS
jgi:hypothetical protein